MVSTSSSPVRHPSPVPSTVSTSQSSVTRRNRRPRPQTVQQNTDTDPPRQQRHHARALSALDCTPGTETRPGSGRPSSYAAAVHGFDKPAPAVFSSSSVPHRSRSVTPDPQFHRSIGQSAKRQQIAVLATEKQIDEIPNNNYIHRDTDKELFQKAIEIILSDGGFKYQWLNNVSPDLYSAKYFLRFCQRKNNN